MSGLQLGVPGARELNENETSFDYALLCMTDISAHNIIAAMHQSLADTLDMMLEPRSIHGKFVT